MWYSRIVASLSALPDFINHYERELEDAKKDCKIYGVVEKNITALPGITEHRFRILDGLFCSGREFYTTFESIGEGSFAASASVDLRFNHDTGRGIDFIKCGFEILSGVDGYTFGSSDAELLKKFLGLVFVNIHKLNMITLG